MSKKAELTPESPVEAIRRYLLGRPEVAVAYLFGSHATGRARPGSDIDVAVLLRHGGAPVGRLELRLDIMGDLESLTRGRVDVIDLEAAGSVLQHQVLKHGLVLVDKDPGCRVRFEVAVRRRYIDTRRRRQEYVDSLVAVLKRGEPLGGSGDPEGALEVARRIYRRSRGR